jgi:deoxyribonuclease V
MLASVDVDYRPDATVAACVVFQDWGDAAEAAHKRADRLCREG